MSTIVEDNQIITTDTTSEPQEAHIGLPRHNRGKAAAFNIFLSIAIVLNLVCGVLMYTIQSKGEILEDLYDTLVSYDIEMFVWIAAGIGLIGAIFTLVAYVLSFDYRRPARPVGRLWALWTSFGVFLAGVILGLLGVSATDVFPILGSLVLCFVLPLPVLFIERGLFSGALRTAHKSLANHSASSARASARTALTFRPGHPEALSAYGLALAEAGKHLQALPYLLYTEEREVPLQPRTTAALANAWEAAGDRDRTIAYLDKLPPEDATPELLDRQVRLWLSAGHRDRARETIRGMSTDARRPWRDEYQGLLVEARDQDGLHALAAEIRAEDEKPYEASTAILKDILSVFPNDVFALESLINIQKELKQPDIVAALQEEVINLDDHRIEIRRELLDYYWQHGNRSELLRHLNRIMISGQATPDEKVRFIEETYADGDYLTVEELVTHDSDLATNARANVVLANALFQGGRTDAALEWIAQARRLGPDARLAQNLDALSAKIRKTVLDSELTELQHRAGEAPADLDLKFEYMDRLVASGSADRVVVQLDDILSAHPEMKDRIEKEIRVMLSRHGKNRRLMDYLGDLYLRNSEFDKAYDLYERRAQGEMDSAEILHDAAQRILSRSADHIPSLQSEIRYFYSHGQHAEALHVFDQLQSLGADMDRELRLIEMQSAEAAGDKARAIRAGEHFLAENPDDTEMLSRIGQLSLELEQYPEAIARLEKAVELDPDSFEFRRQYRHAVETSKKTRIAEIKEQLKEFPGDRDLLEELGDLYHDFDQLNDAIASYQRSGQNAPDRRIARAKQGYVLARKGLFTDADEILKEADLRSDLPEDEQERLKNLFFITAQLMEQEDEHERALELYRRIFRVDAGYRNVVEHVERLQVSGKKKRQNQY